MVIDFLTTPLVDRSTESERWRSTIETAAMSKRHGTRSKKLGNAVPKRGDPDAVYCDCEPDHCHRPSRPNSRTGFCDHVIASFSIAQDFSFDDAARA